MSQSTFTEPLPRPDLSDVDWDSLSSWGLRVGMASLGWVSEISLRRRDNYRMDARVECHHGAWHGSLADVKIWKNLPGLPSESADASVCAMAVRECLADVAKEARRAWDTCTDWVPSRGLALGELVVNEADTQYLRNYPHPGVVRPERSRPTEALPGWPGQPTLDEFLGASRVDGEAWLGVAMQVASSEGPATVRWADRLHPWKQADAWGYTDRRWTYESMCRIQRWNGTLINTSLSKGTLGLSNGNVTALGALCLAKATLSTVESMEAAYGADDAPPPGLHEYVPPNFDPDPEAAIEALRYVPATAIPQGGAGPS